MNPRKKILLLAYAISPTRGSEYAIAWDNLLNISKDNDVTILYGTSGDHMGDTKQMEDFIKIHPLLNVRFIPVKPNSIAKFLNIPNKKKIFAYSFYFAYNIWHKQVYKKVKELFKYEKFDLIHYLGPTGYREPGYLWKFKIPYIWGPIAGIPNRPKQLFKSLPLKYRITFTIRNWVNTVQFRYNYRLKRAFFRTDLLLTATTDNQKMIKKYYNKSSIYWPENGILNNINSEPIKITDISSDYTINILWIGSIDPRKSLNILLEAISKINLNNWHIHVVGDGPRKAAMQKLSTKLKIGNKISWHGQIERKEVLTLLKTSHLHVLTSLGEATTTVLWEAMSNGIPTISLDHCGMHDVICPKCGIRIPIESYEHVILNLTQNLNRLILNPIEINKLSKGVINCAKKHSSEHRRIFINEMYDLTILNWIKTNKQK